jgi:hypothetical protein
MAEPLITDHLFRVGEGKLVRLGQRGSSRVRPGHCCYRGTCDRPQEDHITRYDFERRRDDDPR